MVGFPLLPRCYVFALGIFAAFPSHSRALSQGSIGGLFYVNFMIDQFSYLNITSIGRNLIQDENDCGYACLEIPSCFSYNVAAFPDINNKRLCELLPSDKFNNSDKFNASEEFHHFFIPSSCDNSPCKSTGKCIPSYQENGYKCICVKGFTGKNCETNINDCDNSTCLNNGTCIDLINGFNCSCPSGFAGNRCETGALTSSSILGSLDSKYLSQLSLYLDPVLQSAGRSKFVRCWHAKTDGWAVSTFHSNCDRKGPTVTIVQVGSYIFGGYTDKSWFSQSSYRFVSSSKSFLFSLYNINGYAPVKLNIRSSRYSYAIASGSSYGPFFGGGADLLIKNNASSNQNSFTRCGNTYHLPPGYSSSGSSCRFYAGGSRAYFTPTDVEVFYETKT